MSRHPEPTRIREMADLTTGARREVLEHLRICASCRALLTAEEPSRLFAVLSVAPVGDRLLERLSGAVEQSIDDAPATGRPARTRHAAAGLAASLLLAGLVGIYLWDRQPLAPAPLPVAPEVDVVEAEVPAGPTRPPVGIELLSPDAAEVVNFIVGDTQVVMIFDEALDL